MKRTTLGVLLSVILSTAQAGGLSIADKTAITFSGYDGQPSTVTGAKHAGYTGSLIADSAGTFIAAYLGSEASYKNSFSLTGGNSLLKSDPLYKSISAEVGPGLVAFSFSDDHGKTFVNGMPAQTNPGFAILEDMSSAITQQVAVSEQKPRFDYILGFNDSFKGDADFDDFVIGVKFIASPVPEAEMGEMMLAGIGLVGFVGTRRRLFGKEAPRRSGLRLFVL